jgi:phage-related protein
MSISLSVATVLEKNRVDSDVPFLPLIDIEVVDPATGSYVETLRFVRNDEPITHDGNEYVPVDFDLTLTQAINEQARLDLSIVDYSQAVQAQMQAYGGGVGFNVTFRVVDASQLAEPPEIVEYFEVISASAADYSASFQLGSENALTAAFPKRRQTRDFCQWRFKDPETCGYVGPATECDLTLQGDKGCVAKGWKPITFGGFPGINSNGVRYA